MMKTTTSVLILALALFLVMPVSAQDQQYEVTVTNFIDNYTGDFDDASKKLVDLAAAIPADKFGWRPAEGIRSVSEVYMHVAGANFALSSALGVAMPDGVNLQSLEADVTEKQEVIEVLQASQKQVHKALGMVKDEDLSGKVQAFGREWTRFQVLFIISGHSHEHLGQSIAYARSNDIAPPWSGGGQ